MGKEEDKKEEGIVTPGEEATKKPQEQFEPIDEGEIEEGKKTKEEETPNVNEAQAEPLIAIFPGPMGISIKCKKGLPLHTARGILKEADSWLYSAFLMKNIKALLNPKIIKPGPGFRGH